MWHLRQAKNSGGRLLSPMKKIPTKSESHLGHFLLTINTSPRCVLADKNKKKELGFRHQKRFQGEVRNGRDFAMFVASGTGSRLYLKTISTLSTEDEHV